jgi:hypothetical protein
MVGCHHRRALLCPPPDFPRRALTMHFVLLCGVLVMLSRPVTVTVKVKAYELRKKSGADLLKQLEDLRSELAKVLLRHPRPSPAPYTRGGV